MISRCLTRWEELLLTIVSSPSQSKATPRASSHLRSTQCAHKRDEVPSTGHVPRLLVNDLRVMAGESKTIESNV